MASKQELIQKLHIFLQQNAAKLNRPSQWRSKFYFTYPMVFKEGHQVIGCKKMDLTPESVIDHLLSGNFLVNDKRSQWEPMVPEGKDCLVMDEDETFHIRKLSTNHEKWFFA